MNRAFTNILTGNVEQTAEFYEDLLGLKRTGDFGWFVRLSHEDKPGFELGILNKDHDTIPEGVAKTHGGCIFTFVVSDLDVVVANAQAMQADIIQKPTDLPYGQRRLMLRDPNGTAVDISAPIR
ncbi:VOC family protein [Ruegeria sp. HKCCD7255]|uniref:VOC family protein n=1 Tax=Ruegeria sp. HKCCD7255 TaxID=2683004 RepID=UPI001488D657|nr:VOC family protein [Ruegeria sp. HKCCD7255]